MARNGKSISVKIATPKVIKALETRLAELETNYANQEANEAKYTKAFEKYKKELIAYAVSQHQEGRELSHKLSLHGTNTLNIDFDLTVSESELPKEPQREFEQMGRHNYLEQKQEIENAIRILKMTDEETVNTSTYNAIARYL
jgi:hypothetical protein